MYAHGSQRSVLFSCCFKLLTHNLLCFSPWLRRSDDIRMLGNSWVDNSVAQAPRRSKFCVWVISFFIHCSRKNSCSFSLSQNESMVFMFKHTHSESHQLLDYIHWPRYNLLYGGTFSIRLISVHAWHNIFKIRNLGKWKRIQYMLCYISLLLSVTPHGYA